MIEELKLCSWIYPSMQNYASVRENNKKVRINIRISNELKEQIEQISRMLELKSKGVRNEKKGLVV